jgi:hypothetical protein
VRAAPPLDDADEAARSEHLSVSSVDATSSLPPSAPSAPHVDDDDDDLSEFSTSVRSSQSFNAASAPPDDAEARRRRPTSVYREQPIPANRDEALRLARATTLELVSRLACARKAREHLLSCRDDTIDALLSGARSAAHAEASDSTGAALQRDSLRLVASLAVDERGRAVLVAHGVPAMLVQVLLQNSDRRVLLQALVAIARLLCDAAVCDEVLDGAGYRAMLEFLAAGDDAIQAAAARALVIAARDRRAGQLAATSKRVRGGARQRSAGGGARLAARGRGAGQGAHRPERQHAERRRSAGERGAGGARWRTAHAPLGARRTGAGAARHWHRRRRSAERDRRAGEHAQSRTFDH